MVTAIFPAAGQSRRMNYSLYGMSNKIFLKLGKYPILVHTLKNFSKSQLIDNLIIVAVPDEILLIENMLKKVKGLKPYKIVDGGSERQYSVANALRSLPFDTSVVLIHDAARPFIRTRIIDQVIDDTVEYGSAITAVPATNTIKTTLDNVLVFDEEIGEKIFNTNLYVKDTIPRENIVEVQTPQGFRRNILMRAHNQAAKDGFLGTDDSSLVERAGFRVKIVEGDYFNIKITTPEDLLIAKSFLPEFERRNSDDEDRSWI